MVEIPKKLKTRQSGFILPMTTAEQVLKTNYFFLIVKWTSPNYCFCDQHKYFLCQNAE